MNWFTIYLLTRCEGIGVLLGLLIAGIIIMIIVGIMYGAVSSDNGDDDGVKTAGKLIIKSIIALIAVSFVFVLTPSSKDIAIIIAGNWAANSEEVKKLPDNVVGTMNKFMENYLEKETKANK